MPHGFGDFDNKTQKSDNGIDIRVIDENNIPKPKRGCKGFVREPYAKILAMAKELKKGLAIEVKLKTKESYYAGKVVRNKLKHLRTACRKVNNTHNKLYIYHEKEN